MIKIRRTNQSGSIAMFIVVSVVLAALLIGAVYYVNQRGEQARRDQAIAAANANQQKVNNNSDEQKTTETPTKTEQDTNNAQNLPVTGPDFSLVGLAEAFIITVVATSYVSSRRALKSYL